MAAQSHHRQDMKSKRPDKLRIEAGGGGGILVIGGALIAAAVGAAFVAHRARSSTKGRQQHAIDKEEEGRGLQSLLPSADQNHDDPRKAEGFSVDSLVGGQESTSEKSEIGETIESEKSEEGFESSAEVVWPEEVIEQQKQLPSFEINGLKERSEMPESFGDKFGLEQTEDSGVINHREDEFCFDSSVEIQETVCNDSEIINETREILSSCKVPEMVMETKENQIEGSSLGPIDGNAIVEEFSFWSVKSSAPEIHTEQNLPELETVHVPEEGKSEPNEEQEESCIDGEKRAEGSEIMEDSSAELSEDTAWPEMPIEKDESPSAETSGMKQQLAISEKNKDICASEGEENTVTLQDLLPSTKGQVFVDSSEENICNDLKMVAEILESHNTRENSEMALETRESQSEANPNDDNSSTEESYIPHIEGEEEEGGSSIKSQEDIELQLEDVGESGGEESEGSRNSSVEFSDQAVWPEDNIEQEKMDGSKSITEMKHQLEIPRKIEEVDGSAEGNTNYNNHLVQESLSDIVEISMPDNQICEILEESDIACVSCVEVKEGEGEGEEIEEEEEEGEVEEGEREGEGEGEGEGVEEVEVAKEEEEEEEEEEDDEEEGLAAKSLVEGERLPVEEESEGELSSIEIRNSSMELGKLLVPMYEMNQKTESPEKIKHGTNAEGNENTTAGIHSLLAINDKHKEIPIDSSVALQEKVYMNLDVETEERQSTCKNSDMVMEIVGNQPVANSDISNVVVKACSYCDEAFNFLQGQNKQDKEESEITHVKEEEQGFKDPSVGSQEEETELSLEEDSKRTNRESEETIDASVSTSAETTLQREVIEEEKGLPVIEREMKLQSEIPKNTADAREDEKREEEDEQEVVKKGSATIVAEKERRTDFILIVSSKVFLLVLALALAVGLLAFASHDHLHHYKRRLPKIYHQLYQLFFPSDNGALDEF